jgi:hypothetical protein
MLIRIRIYLGRRGSRTKKTNVAPNEREKKKGVSSFEELDVLYEELLEASLWSFEVLNTGLK